MELEKGKILVKLARRSVENFFEKNKLEIEETEEKEFKEKKGVFVTIETYPENELRGCIGFPLPYFSLYEAVQRAAVSSAFEDFRFEPLRKEELKKVVFEVSILTKPELIKVRKPEEYLEKIEGGKDGLILEYRSFSALYLPQVWDVIPEKEKFLESLCLKAGLHSNAWKEKGVKIFRFRVEAFKEKEPEGEVVRVV
ncbi:MAG: AmmeMemoRadiSam system protein A [Candidatus Aenigmatarchaeota archaeon]